MIYIPKNELRNENCHSSKHKKSRHIISDHVTVKMFTLQIYEYSNDNDNNIEKEKKIQSRLLSKAADFPFEVAYSIKRLIYQPDLPFIISVTPFKSYLPPLTVLSKHKNNFYGAAATLLHIKGDQL